MYQLVGCCWHGAGEEGSTEVLEKLGRVLKNLCRKPRRRRLFENGVAQQKPLQSSKSKPLPHHAQVIRAGLTMAQPDTLVTKPVNSRKIKIILNLWMLSTQGVHATLVVLDALDAYTLTS